MVNELEMDHSGGVIERLWRLMWKKTRIGALRNVAEAQVPKADKLRELSLFGDVRDTLREWRPCRIEWKAEDPGRLITCCLALVFIIHICLVCLELISMCLACDCETRQKCFLCSCECLSPQVFHDG